jgi:PTS system mannose-specific IIC component
VYDLFPLALLGGVLGLDVVSFPQAMVSRPLVAATAAGFMVGNGAAGLLIGAALELIALETLPFGASRYPEWGSAAVVGGALFASHGSDGTAGGMTVAVIGSLATAMVGGWTMAVLRRLNANWARMRLPSLDRGSYRTVIGLQLYGLTADLVRGIMLTFIALLLLNPIAEALIALWSVDARLSRAVVVALCGMVAAGAVWKLVHGTPGARWLFLGGLALGTVLLLLQIL